MRLFLDFLKFEGEVIVSMLYEAQGAGIGLSLTLS